MAGGRAAGASLHLLLLWLCAAATTAWAHGGGGSDADGGGGEGKPDLWARGLMAAKLWCVVIVFAGTMAAGVSPYFMRRNEAFLVLGTQFAGGVFNATAVAHFFSDANETFGDLVPDSGYPYAFILACAGYVLTMLADCAILFVDVAAADSDEEAIDEETITEEEYEYYDDQFDDLAEQEGLEEGMLGSTNGNSSDPSAADAARHDHSVASMLRNASTVGDSVVFIATLCFHSVFEGIAIGVAETKADAWKALWTISLNKIFAAIAMGIVVLRMLPNRPFLTCFGYAFAFAISSPVGIGIGSVIDATTQSRMADWIFAIYMSLATGIFFYVSNIHLFSKGYKPQRPVAADTPVGRLLAFMLGVSVIAVAMIWDT